MLTAQFWHAFPKTKLEKRPDGSQLNLFKSIR